MHAGTSGHNVLLIVSIVVLLQHVGVRADDVHAARGSVFGSDERTRVTQLVDELRTCRNIAGLVVSVVSGNESVLVKGSGQAVVETQTPATSKTRVCVASLTKAFTATLLGQLLLKRK